MRKTLLLTMAMLLFTVTSHAADTRTDKTILTVMTLNAEFMWDGIDPEEGQAEFDHKGSQEKAEKHMGRIAGIILLNDPDIVNLVEIENENALNTLNEKFLNSGYRTCFVKGRDTYTGQDMGLLTRIDPVAPVRYDARKGKSGDVEKSVSKNYVADFEINGMRISMIGLHFLSRPSDGSRIHKRQAQADAVHLMALEKQAAGNELIILGDFNDYDGAPGSRDHIDSMPITTVLDMIKGMDREKDSDDLVNAASFVAKAQRYTGFWDKDHDSEIDRPGEFTGIDHILLSPGLAGKVKEVTIFHGHDPRVVTDHFPVMVRLEF